MFGHDLEMKTYNSQASDETHPRRQRGSQSVARTTLVNKPDKYGETIAIVYKPHEKKSGDAL